MNLTTQLRLILLVCGVLLLLGMYWFGRRKSSDSGFKAQRFDPHRVEDDMDDDLDDNHSLQTFEEDESQYDSEHEPLLVNEVPANARSFQPSREARSFSERVPLHDEEAFTVAPISSRTEPVWHDEEMPLAPTTSQWQVPEIEEESAFSANDGASKSVETDTDHQPTYAEDKHASNMAWQESSQPVLNDPVVMTAKSSSESPSEVAASEPLPPLLDEAAAVEMAIMAESIMEPEPEPEPAPRPASRSARASTTSAAPASRKIMALRLAFVPERVAGDQLLSLLQGERLQLGKFNIFHRLHEQQSVFSVASMVEPGTFDLQSMPSQHYVGVTLFTMLPGVMDAPMMFEQMLGCAQRIARATGGELQDERGSKLSPYIIERLRDEVLDFQHLLGRAGASPVTTDTADTVDTM
jgi:cell division protein ZipA